MLKLTKTAIKISNRPVEYDLIIAKILFVGQIKYKPQGISNIVLANREARLRAPSGGEFPPPNQRGGLPGRPPKRRGLFGKIKYNPQVIPTPVLATREARLRARSGEDFPPQNQWAALRAAHQKVGVLSESLILEYLYDFARTYFIKNS